MPGVLTRAEYLSQKAQAPDQAKREPEVKTSAPSPSTGDVVVMEHFLFYPDNPAGAYYSGSFRVTVDGKEETLQIEKGVIRTTNEDIRSELVRRGFSYMYGKKAGELQ